MSKNIVLCLDGTWNGPDVKSTKGEPTPTNVQKLFESLAGSRALGPADNELEIDSQDPQQSAKYLHGVGNTNNVLASYCQGATGLGLVSRIIRGYTYLSRVYQPGDRIYITGFSRGAYTARALGGFIARQGLLDWAKMKLEAGSEASYSAGLGAWYRYKSALHANDMGMVNRIASAFCTLQDKLDASLHPAPALKFIRDVPIEAIGVWDTVGALGIPELGDSAERVDEFKFVDNVLRATVRSGFHAVAIDDQRIDFTPSLWAAREGVRQVLFPGAHADVGGGYPAAESGLSDCALDWMLRQLAATGVLFGTRPALNADPAAIQHCPWADSEPNKVLYDGRTGQRHFPPGLGLSLRALQRMQATTVPVEKAAKTAYRPQNLANSYIVLGTIDPAPHVEVIA